jgi:hypothetical protein
MNQIIGFRDHRFKKERTLHDEKREECVDEENSEETGRQRGNTQKRDTGILVLYSKMKYT